MFTLIPSLYFLGVQYFQQWNTTPQQNVNPMIEISPKLKVKTRRKNRIIIIDDERHRSVNLIMIILFI